MEHRYYAIHPGKLTAGTQKWRFGSNDFPSGLILTTNLPISGQNLPTPEPETTPKRKRRNIDHNKPPRTPQDQKLAFFGWLITLGF